MVDGSNQDRVASDIARQYLRLHLADGIGPVFLGRLIKRFKTIEDILRASEADLCEVEGIGPRRARGILEARRDNGVEQQLERAALAGVRIICWEDAEYPAHLRHCDDPPICLYLRGQLQAEDAVAIAIVGSRKCSRYGYEQARRFGGLLAGAGFTVVSGLARGIDGYAHEGALLAGGRTLAVLGCGVDVVYPPEHEELAQRVTGSGALVAEDPLGSPPTVDSFPRRNRIIAGLCMGVIVVEANRRSGALITARLASEYNREVFALPGRVDTPTAAGPNDLIRKGAAKLVANLEDILDELGEVGASMGKPAGKSAVASSTGDRADARDLPNGDLAALDETERNVLGCLGSEEVHLDRIAEEVALPIGQVMSALTTLQLKGVVVAIPGNSFARRRRA